MPDLILDIEAVAPKWEELHERTRAYLAERSRKFLSRENNIELGDVDEESAEVRAADRLALEHGLARVVAIGIHNCSERRSTIMLNVPEGIERFTIGGAYRTELSDEATMLKLFWSTMKKYGRNARIVTYNGRGYDGPVMMIRSAQLGIECTRDLVGYRYDLSSNCDLSDAITFQGAVRGWYDLDYWCRAFGIESPKSKGCTGADVDRLWREGKYESIGTYLRDDIEATAQLYERLKPMLTVFKGGPLFEYREPQLSPADKAYNGPSPFEDDAPVPAGSPTNAPDAWGGNA